ncbi:hypothetical protein EYF80_023727 [Liparis tanakae]|uniref:Uncharacterized protein n=1 Tax=Liparis tanakae TaxID=230148 RepID=A0A4Z2HJL8_9TELE|nr:hypothetical protein EYF80_023727 [Liparis tanakae]
MPQLNSLCSLWPRSCSLREPAALKPRRQILQLNGFTGDLFRFRAWKKRCVPSASALRAVPVRYDRLHTAHVNGVMPVCFRLCTVSEWAYLKVSSHMLHLYFFELEWTIWWKRSVSLLLNSLPQVAQPNGRSSECTDMWHLSCTDVRQLLSHRWFSKDRSIRKVFPHCSQVNGFGGLDCWWRTRSPFQWNVTLQCSQGNRFASTPLLESGLAAPRGADPGGAACLHSKTGCSCGTVGDVMSPLTNATGADSGLGTVTDPAVGPASGHADVARSDADSFAAAGGSETDNAGAPVSTSSSCSTLARRASFSSNSSEENSVNTLWIWTTRHFSISWTSPNVASSHCAVGASFVQASRKTDTVAWMATSTTDATSLPNLASIFVLQSDAKLD